jgi:DNA-binding XRE family transcriptional regulator
MRPDDKTEVARRFKALRRRAFLTQRWLAEYIGVSRQAVSEIENKRALPHFSTWDSFAALEAKHMQPRIKLPVHWE